MKKIILATLIVAMLAGGCAHKSKGRDYAVTGALLGATVGALTFNNKVSGAAIGAGAGLLLGYIVGNEMDKYDRQQVSSTLESTPSGQTTSWQNPDTGTYYQATPQSPYQEDGRVYRDVQIQTTVDGQPEVIHAKAYRNPDGSWQLVQ